MPGFFGDDFINVHIPQERTKGQQSMEDFMDQQVKKNIIIINHPHSMFMNPNDGSSDKKKIIKTFIAL